MHPTSRATKAVTDGWIASEDEEGEEEEGGDDEAMLALFEEEEDGDTDVESDSDSPDEMNSCLTSNLYGQLARIERAV